MNKLICDICGTSYPESADNCPICGTSKTYSVDMDESDSAAMPEYISENTNRGKFFSAGRMAPLEFYDQCAPESDAPQDILPEEQFSAEYLNRPGTNMVLVAVLTIVIAVFLIGTGYLFLRYQLPNRLPQTVLEQKTETNSTFSTQSEETTESTIPCRSLVLISGVPEINRIGQYWLLHVTVSPEDTTDTLTFTSSDESVVTVTEEGRLCAIAEGEATILITCGNEQISCAVTVRIPDEPESAEESEETGEYEDVLTTETEDPEERLESPDETPLTLETEPVVQPTQMSEPANVTLKLTQTDISFTKKGVTYELELDCDLDPTEVSWMTLDPKVAICRDGVITVIGNGTTRIYATYGDQEVYCVVRVSIK